MTRAVIYLRISRDDTGQQLAIQRQNEDCLKLVEDNDWDLVETYTDDSISAYSRTKSRPSYERMRSDYEAGHFDVLVCWDLDRLTRQPAQLEQWIELSETRNLRIITATGEADLALDGGRMFARVKASFARGESERKSARHKRANEQKVASGKPTGGKRPFGYQSGGMEPLELEAQRIREGYNHILNGGSIHGLCREWNDSGLLTSTGKQWSPIQVKKVLLRKRNKGVLIFRGEEAPNSQITPLVDEDLFDKAEAILQSRSVSKGGREPLKYVLTGIATCGACGSPMSGKSVRIKKYDDRVPYYICATKAARTSKSDGTRHVSIMASILEKEVTREVANAFLFGYNDLFPAPVNTDLGSLHQALNEAQEGRERLMSFVVAGTITEAEATRQFSILGKEQERLQKAITDTHSRSASSAVIDIRGDLWSTSRADFDDAAKAMTALRENYVSLPADKKRKLAADLLDITIYPGKGAKRIHVEHRKVVSLNNDEVHNLIQ